MNENKNKSFENSDFDAIFESIKNFSNSDQNNTNSNQESSSNSDSPNIFSNLDMNTIMKLTSFMNKMKNSNNDPRSNLLLSLKPYLKPSRKEKVDQYIKIFNMTQILENFNSNGGEVK